ncbi:MAG: acetolactate synthase [Blautia sp.]|nr:acetolactate synthase [Blautia sp.]
MAVKQISVFLENQPGKLAELAAVLSTQKINLRAISVAEASDFGIVRIIVDDVFNAVTGLKSENYICSLTDVRAVEVQDEAGMLANMLGVLGAEGINIEYMYTILGKKTNVAYMIIRTNADAQAAKILEAKGFKSVDSEAMK